MIVRLIYIVYIDFILWYIVASAIIVSIVLFGKLIEIVVDAEKLVFRSKSIFAPLKALLCSPNFNLRIVCFADSICAQRSDNILFMLITSICSWIRWQQSFSIDSFSCRLWWKTLKSKDNNVCLLFGIVLFLLTVSLHVFLTGCNSEPTTQLSLTLLESLNYSVVELVRFSEIGNTQDSCSTFAVQWILRGHFFDWSIYIA